MANISFQPDDTLYKHRDSLSEDYTPETIVGRDDEIREYHSALQPVINGETPNNIFLFGKTGIGKTAVTTYLLNQLASDAASYELDLTVVQLNCEGLNSSYQVAVNLVNRLRDPENLISETGHPLYGIYGFLWDELDKLGGTVIIVLDEVDNIGEDDSILYQIPRARANENISSSKVGIIGISNDLGFRENLSAKVRSSLCEKSISFPPYNATELRAVLDQRAAVAFHESAIGDDVVTLCAAFGAQDAGDARKALDLLRGAGDLARAKDAEVITEDHVRRARVDIEREELMEGIGDLAHHQQLTLYAVATLEAQEVTPARSEDVFRRYEQLCASSGHDPRTSRRVRDFLSDLDSLSIVTSSRRTEGRRGQYSDHQLNHDIKLVLTAMSELIDSVGIHQSILHLVTGEKDALVSPAEQLSEFGDRDERDLDGDEYGDDRGA